MQVTSKSYPKILLAFGAALLIAFALLLSGCGASETSQSGAQSAAEGAAEDNETVVVAAVPTPHAEVLNDVVKDLLAQEGYTLEVKEFTDYVLPNTATEEEEVDANYFQHQPYLENFNEEQGTHLVPVVAVHFEPFGLYSDTLTDLASLEDGALVAVPNDATNEARALLLLEQEGLITLNPDAGITATVADITDNPKNLQFVELEAAIVPTMLQDVDLAAINGNYAIEAGLDPEKALAIEANDSLAADTYANILVVKEGNENASSIQALAKALNSDEVRDYLNNNYKGAVLAVF